MKIDPIYQGRALAGNKSTAYPNRQLFLDTEVRIGNRGIYHHHVFAIGWTHYILDTGRSKDSVDRWDLWKNLDELNAFIEKCTADKTTLRIYGHNLYYDLQVIGFFHRFAVSHWTLDFIYDKGLSFILAIKKGNRRIKCISTTNYFDYSLAILGESMGMKKLDVDPLKASDNELVPYCRQDVEILTHAVLKYQDFNREHDTGKFAATRASQAFNCFRHRFMDHAIYIHADKRVKQLERDAYFGGRVEAFRWGVQTGGPFVFLDVNSMYPYVMHRYRYPSKVLEYVENASLAYLKHYLPSCAMIADVTLETREPMFAYRGKDKLLFPVGRFRTCVCTEGLRRAIDAGMIEEVHRLALYECRFLFRSYVDYFYPLKSAYKTQGNLIYTAIVKLFLNSLYGKFGMKIAKEEKIDNPEMTGFFRRKEIDASTGVTWMHTGMFGKEILQYGEIDGRNSFTGVAAHVTEYARFTLWDFFNRADRDRVLYCDTDSLVLRERDLLDCDFSLDPQLLGSLDLDRRTQRLVLYNPKDYATDTGRKTKGIPKDAEQTGPHSWQYEQFKRLATHQREGVTEGFLSCKTEKTINLSYDKGIVLPDGAIVPYCFGGS